MSKFTPSQEKAILNNGSDLLISAGAGSGKTTTLTERIVGKILEGDDISKKLVVTFTKEAANSLKSKLTEKLAKKLKDATVDKREHLRSQIVKTSSADISTIHSFCLKIIRPNFDKLPIDSDFKIGEENEIEYIKNEVMKEVVSELYESDTPSDDFLIVCDFYSQIARADSLEKNLLSLYDSLSSTSLFLDTLLISQNNSDEFMQTVYGEFLIDKILLFVHHYKPIYESIIEEIVAIDGTPKYLDVFTSDLEAINSIEIATKAPSYSKLKQVFDSYEPLKLNGFKDSGICDKDFIKDLRDEFKKDHKKIKTEFFANSVVALKTTFNQNMLVCKAMHKILTIFEERFKERKRKYGLCDFNDIERYAYTLLCDKNGAPTPLAQKISLDYNEIYIDEYQDTNALQDAIFASISRNNRFMVGDVKQSIYRFRSAEPEIFSSYRDKFVDIDSDTSNCDTGKIIFMSENFRCDENIIKFSNVVSDYMFTNEQGIAYKLGIPYSKEDNLIFKKVYDDGIKPVPQKCEVCIIDRADIEENEDKTMHLSLQARYVAKRIYNMVNNERLPDGRAIKLSDIAILVRKRKYIRYYIEALSELGIDTEYIDSVKFFEKPHILLIWSLLNAIDNPYKDTYLSGAIHSPIFGFSFDDLIKIRKASDKDVPLYSALLNYSENEELVKKINNFKEKLFEMQNEIRKMNAYEAVSYVMNASGILSSANRNERKDLIKFYNHAREFEKGSYKGLYRFLNYIESIKDSKLQETIFTSPDDCVRIMTTHTSKGLEFEVCFLCNMETPFYSKEARNSVLFERHLGVAGYVGNKDGLIKYNTVLRKISKYAIEKAGRDEEMCLLYVGMTRAKSKLILTASVDDFEKTKDEFQSMASFSSKHYLYSSKSAIEFVMKALCTTDYDSFACYDKVNVDSLLDSDNQSEENEKELDSELLKSLQSTLRTRFDFEYKYDYLNKLPSKISVSRLKPDMLDSYENDEIDLTKELERKPKFLLNENVKTTGAEKGTATHVFMQFCDFDNLEKNGYDMELERLLNKSFISKSDAEIISKSHIEAFKGSSVFKAMKSAKMIKREFRFNVMLPASELTNDVELKKQSVLVQGVVDAVFIDENDNLVLVDYKTDKVDESNYKEVLKERYTTQLSYYKKAIEIIFERTVDKLLIYSVPLAKEVEI